MVFEQARSPIAGRPRLRAFLFLTTRTPENPLVLLPILEAPSRARLYYCDTLSIPNNLAAIIIQPQTKLNAAPVARQEKSAARRAPWPRPQGGAAQPLTRKENSASREYSDTRCERPIARSGNRAARSAK